MTATIIGLMVLVAIILMLGVAPTPTARVTPDGTKLKDGYQTLFTFEDAPDVALWEKTVKPFGLDGGDMIDITTMHNETLRTFWPRSLITLTEGSFTAAYDPAVVQTLISDVLNVPQAITAHYPDGSSDTFYGALTKFERGDHKEGEFPEATCTVVPTNTDPDTDEEELPVYTPPGTGT